MKTGGIVVCSTFVALVFPGVLLWPICHPTYLNNRQAWPCPVWRMTSYGTRGLVSYESNLDKNSHFSESMVLASLLGARPFVG